MSALPTDAITWTSLLAQWVQFAQASLALPEDADGPRWRQSVVAVINLQSVTFALADLHQLSADEKALGLDKAELLIADSVARLHSVWEKASMPPSLDEIISDSQIAFRAACGDSIHSVEVRSQV